MVRYWGNEGGVRTFNILIDDEKLVTENLTGKWNVSEFKNVEYPIPVSMIEGKSEIRVKFKAPSNGYAGGVFYIRLLTREPTYVEKLSYSPGNRKVFFRGLNKSILVSGTPEKGNVNIFDLSGRLITSKETGTQSTSIAINSGVYLAQFISEKNYITSQKVIVY